MLGIQLLKFQDMLFVCDTLWICSALIAKEEQELRDSSLIRMPLKGKGIRITPLHGGIYIQGGPFRAIGIRLDRINGASSRTLLSVPKDICSSVDLAPHEFPLEITLSAQIFRPNFRTGQLHAVPEWIHLGPAQIDGVNEFMNQNCVCVVRARHVFLAQIYFGPQSQLGGSLLVALELIQEDLCGFCAVGLFGG